MRKSRELKCIAAEFKRVNKGTSLNPGYDSIIDYISAMPEIYFLRLTGMCGIMLYTTLRLQPCLVMHQL